MKPTPEQSRELVALAVQMGWAKMPPKSAVDPYVLHVRRIQRERAARKKGGAATTS